MSLFILFLFSTLCIFGHAQDLKCYREGYDDNGIKNCYRDTLCYKKNCFGKVFRSCGECNSWDMDKCNCKNCTGDLCNDGQIEPLSLQCYEQREGEVKPETGVCQNKFCKWEDCDGQVIRGCGDCDMMVTRGCKCQNCTGDLCNGEELKNVGNKCYSQTDDDDSKKKEKRCKISQGKFCSKAVCERGDQKARIRDCGKCSENMVAASPDCKCTECEGELCNGVPRMYANGNNLVGICILVAMLVFFH